MKGANDGGAFTKSKKRLSAWMEKFFVEKVPSVLQRSSQVRAAIGNCKNLSVKIGGDEDRESIDFNGYEVTSSDVVRFQHSDPFLLIR